MAFTRLLYPDVSTSAVREIASLCHHHGSYLQRIHDILQGDLILSLQVQHAVSYVYNYLCYNHISYLQFMHDALHEDRSRYNRSLVSPLQTFSILHDMSDTCSSLIGTIPQGSGKIEPHSKVGAKALVLQNPIRITNNGIVCLDKPAQGCSALVCGSVVQYRSPHTCRNSLTLQNNSYILGTLSMVCCSDNPDACIVRHVPLLCFGFLLRAI